MRGIDKFPPVFHPVIQLLAAKNVHAIRALAGKNFLLDQFKDNTRRVWGEQLKNEEPTWFGAVLKPCVFVAAVGLDGHGENAAVSAGHFSTAFSRSELENFLKALVVEARQTRVFLLGLGEKTSHASLQETVDKLCGVISDYGIPLSQEWRAEDRPIIRDTRSGHIISELGFGLIVPEAGQDSQARQDYGGRFVFFGATRSETICLSALLPQDQKNHAYGYVFNQETGIESFLAP